MKVTNDSKERMKIFGSFMLQSYKVVMGTMLSLFVAQKCENEQGVEQICSLEENRNRQEVFPSAVFLFNGMTLIAFIATYLVELMREDWCVENFDIEPSVPDIAINDTLKNKRELREELHFRNKLYFKCVRTTAIMYFFNVILSAYLVLSEEYQIGSATKTGFMSFVLLVTNKLWSSYSVAKKSSQKGIARSAYMREWSSFNILDRSKYTEDAGTLQDIRP
jgi:hypothetical protein